MIKITKIGNTNCNPELKCEFCKKSIPLGMSFFSVILPVDWNPPQNHIGCEKCTKKCKEEVPRLAPRTEEWATMYHHKL